MCKNECNKNESALMQATKRAVELRDIQKNLSIDDIDRLTRDKISIAGASKMVDRDEIITARDREKPSTAHITDQTSGKEHDKINEKLNNISINLEKTRRDIKERVDAAERQIRENIQLQKAEERKKDKIAEQKVKKARIAGQKVARFFKRITQGR